MTTYDTISNAMQRPAVQPHQPAFHLERDGVNWTLHDGARALASFMPHALDIWSFSPFEPEEAANPDGPGHVVDLHTVRNTFLNFGTAGWPGHWNAADLRWQWEQASGDAVVASVTLDARDGETCRWLFTVRYDASWGRYRYRFQIAARKLDPAGFEGFNLMTAGALGARPEERRWTHSLWENADGALRRIVHSSALFYGTDYANMRDPTGPWRARRLSYPQAWMAYAAHPTFNPALLIHRTSVPLIAATCSQLFDEHIVWEQAGQDDLGADGYFHFHMDLEFVNVPAALAASLLAQAADPVRPAAWRHEALVLPFHMDRVNDFESELDPWQPETCPILVLPRDGRGAIAWADDAAHSGSRSLRLRQAEAGRLQLYPVGAVCRVRPRTPYRLSAWVRTQRVTGQARLELAGYAYTYENISHQAASRGLDDTCEWTRLDVELNSGEQAYLMPSLVLEGPGCAWFDDVQLSAMGGAPA
ncbi:MAG: hypothetical protein K8T26_06500 [Lentisphaerae bacterium]|nr:hypothetical protein [Lentisphaerota bacterium]